MNSSKSFASVLGEILQRSYKLAIINASEIQSKSSTSQDADQQKMIYSNSFLIALQEELQELITTCIHTNHARQCKHIRALVKSFHDVRRTDLLDFYLIETFEPILWRSLKCANATVRLQASMLFFDVFPMQKTIIPNHGKKQHEDIRNQDANYVNRTLFINNSVEQIDAFLQRQIDQCILLLKDDDHRIRSVSILGICHLIREYYDTLPLHIIKTLLQYIIEKLSYDASESNVRYHVILGVQDLLLNQPLTHALLKILLPLMKYMLHDKSEKNRVAFAKLLCQVWYTFIRLICK